MAEYIRDQVWQMSSSSRGNNRNDDAEWDKVQKSRLQILGYMAALCKYT